MEVKRSKITELITYDTSYPMVNIVLTKRKKGFKSKKMEDYNIVFTAYNVHAENVLENFKVGDVVDISFKLKSIIKPNRIQTIASVTKIELWKTMKEKIAEKMEEKQEEKQEQQAYESDLEFGASPNLNFDKETGEVL